MAILPMKRWQRKNDWHLTAKRQEEFASLLSEMLLNGFTMQESLRFMGNVNQHLAKAATYLANHLERGELLYSGIQQLNFGADIVGEIRIAEIHGDFSGTLAHIAKYLKEREKQKRSFMKVISYPLLLLVFLFGLIGGMKFILLPHLKAISPESAQTSLGFLFIEYAPQTIGSLFLVVGLAILLTRFYLRRKKGTTKAQIYMKVPLWRSLYQAYITTQFCREWGKLLQQGLEMCTILILLQADGVSPLMRELAEIFQKGLEAGIPIHQQLGKFSFFDKNMVQVLMQGEVKGKLGEELYIYSRLVWQKLIEKTEKWLALVQPLLFLCIAILIVSVYSGILLPLYSQGDLL